MDTTQIIVICITAIISFGGIALAIFFSLGSFRKGVVKELTEIKEKVIKIENTAEKAYIAYLEAQKEVLEEAKKHSLQALSPPDRI